MVDHERLIEDHLAFLDTTRETVSRLLILEGDAATMGVLAAAVGAAGAGGWWLSRLITGLDLIVGIIAVASLLAAVFAAAGGL